jgi:DNA (cytosine-5)-methyltransferase 1
LGLAQAGFKHVLVVERDEHAHATLLQNKKRGVEHVAGWPINQTDVRKVDYSSLTMIDLVAGGPPCQPFSIGGKHGGPGDRRNMWPEAIRAVRELRPKAFLFENVRGLLRPAFAPYLEYLRLYLSWPELQRRVGEPWRDHLRRLKRHADTKLDRVATYKLEIRGINAADYGAPQKRHRVMVVGVRNDLNVDWTFPDATHSRHALVWDQRVTGAYWERHDIPLRRRSPISKRDEKTLAELESKDRPKEKPWVTVRDAIGDLPTPSQDVEPVLHHRLRPGARTYPRHTGSAWDEPAKALKAGNHGVPGGENMLAPGDGSVRYFTIREMARLQGLPDDFTIDGTWKGPIRQLGNAVPVPLARAIGDHLAMIISSGKGDVRAAAAA